MAFSDDNFDVLEMQMLYKFARERGVEKEQLDNLLLQPSHETTIPETLENRIEFLYDLALMIWADNVATIDEVNTLKKYCLKFGFLQENIDELADFLLKNAKENVSKIEVLNSINQ